jgi:hypothetical protein
MSNEEQLRQAVQLADDAAAAMAKLKVGMWDSLQTMALISIAKSLAVIADQQTHR